MEAIMKTILIISAMILGQIAFGANQTTKNVSTLENSDESYELNIVDVLDHGKTEGAEACKTIAMTPAQQQSYMDAKYIYEKSEIQLQATLKLARLDYIKNVMSDAGTEAIATTVTTDSIKTATELMTEKMNFVNKVLFQILDLNQRKLAVACMAEMHKMHHGKKDKN
jgi:hypothetical protein